VKQKFYLQKISVLNKVLIMNAEVLGIIGVHRTGGWTVSQIFEALCLMDDRVVVARTAKGGAFGWGVGNAIAAWYKAGAQEQKLDNLTAEQLLNSNEDNYAIPYSEIKKVELKKFGLGAFINIITDEKKYQWSARGIPGNKNPRIEDFEKILRPVFGGRLAVSKYNL
jgi:hypothetical protein